MEIRENSLTPGQFIRLFSGVGWEPPPVEQVEKALANSLAVFAVYEAGEPVAMARLLGDRGMSYYIKDLAVLPAWQGRGLGRMLMERIEEFIAAGLGPGWAVSLGNH